jgi:outer membrane protein assembly factor BamB
MRRAIPVILTGLLLCAGFTQQSDAGRPDSGAGDYELAAMDAVNGEPTFAGDCVSAEANEFAGTITVERPAAGDVWAAGSKREIRWSSLGYEGDVSILLTAGASWQVIQSALPNTGSYICWLPHQLNSSECLIAVVPSPADFTVFCEQSGPFTIHPDSQGPEVVSAWPSLGGDFDRSGLSENSGPQLGCVKWRFEPAGAVPTSVTIGAEDRTHIACEDGKLYTLDPNGSPLWIFDANSALTSSPTVGPDGSLYVGAENGHLYVIDPNGAIRWTHTANAPIYSSPALSPDGSVFVGSQDGRLYALASDGGEKWSIATKGPGLVLEGAILASPAIGADGTVYIAGLYDPNLYALDPNDGTLKWKCSFIPPGGETEEAGWPFASPVVAPDGTIYQTLLYDSNLYAIDPNDGEILWSTDLDLRCKFVEDYVRQNKEMPPPYMIEQRCDPWYGPGPHAFDHYEAPDGWSEPAIGPDGTIYVSFDDPYLRAVEPNGAIKWVTRLGVVGGFTLTVGSDGVIYAASDDGALCVVDPNGTEIARFSGTAWLNYPVLAPDNTLIVSDGRDYSVLMPDANNAVYAISLAACQTESLALHGPADLNADSRVNFADFALLVAQWAACTDNEPYLLNGYEPLCDYEGDALYLAEDIDMDQYVFISDLIIMADRWLDAGPEAAGPESPLGPHRPPPGWPNPDWYHPGSGGNGGGDPPPKTRTCFPGDTPVWIGDSLSSISGVTAGQKLGNSHCLVASGSAKTIERVEEHQGSFECLDLLLETGERISVVDSHCFMLECGRWAPIQDLKAGSRLKCMTGSVAVRSIVKRQTPFVGRVYNLRIEGSDRYFVGKAGLIVRDY